MTVRQSQPRDWKRRTQLVDVLRQRPQPPLRQIDGWRRSCPRQWSCDDSRSCHDATTWRVSLRSTHPTGWACARVSLPPATRQVASW